jgi:hypothetical protein
MVSLLNHPARHCFYRGMPRPSTVLLARMVQSPYAVAHKHLFPLMLSCPLHPSIRAPCLAR